MNIPAIGKIVTVSGVFCVSWLLSRELILNAERAAVPSTFPESIRTRNAKRALAALKTGSDPLTGRMRLLEILASADAAEFPILFLSAETGFHEKRMLARQWAETDPAGFFRFLRETGRGRKEGDPLYSSVCEILFRTWTADDSDAALAAAFAAGADPVFRLALRTCVLTLMKTDPVKAFAAADQMPRIYFDEDDRLDPAVLTENPAGFLKAAETGSMRALSGRMVKEAVKGVFNRWAKQDPAAAAAWLAAAPRTLRVTLGPALTDQLIASCGTAFTRGWLEGQPPSPDRETAGARLVKAWANEDPVAALAWMKERLQGGRPAAYAALAGALAERGPESVRQLLESMPPGQARDETLSSIATVWADKDAKAAVAWVLSLSKEDPGRGGALRGIAIQWMRGDPEGMAAYLRENPEERMINGQVGSLASRLAQKKLDTALDWALSLGNNHRREAVNALLEDSGAKRFAEIASLAETLDASRRQILVEETVRNTVRGLPFPALDETRLRAVAAMPAGALREAYLSELKRAQAPPERVEKIKG